MPHRIIIENDRVLLEEVYPKRAISTKMLVDKLREQFVAATPIIPRSVVCYANKQQLHFYVLEDRPTERELLLKAGTRNEDGKIFKRKLKLPWVYHIVKFHRTAFEWMSTFFSPKQITALEDPLYYAPLLNIGADNLVCVGDAFTLDVAGKLGDKLNKVVRGFWASEFNFDLSDSYSAGMPEEIIKLTQEYLEKHTRTHPRSPERGSWYVGWEKFSEKQGFDICNLSWKRYALNRKYTLGEYIDVMSGEER